MGMSIDDIVNSFQYMRNHPTTDEEEVIKAGQELFDAAIDTMRKYQKIKSIICKWEVGLYDDEGLCDIEVLELISDEVNGYGNDD